MPLPGPEDPPATNWSAVLGVLFCVTTAALVLADQFGTLPAAVAAYAAAWYLLVLVGSPPA